MYLADALSVVVEFHGKSTSCCLKVYLAPRLLYGHVKDHVVEVEVIGITQVLAHNALHDFIISRNDLDNPVGIDTVRRLLLVGILSVGTEVESHIVGVILGHIDDEVLIVILGIHTVVIPEGAGGTVLHEHNPPKTGVEVIHMVVLLTHHKLVHIALLSFPHMLHEEVGPLQRNACLGKGGEATEKVIDILGFLKRYLLGHCGEVGPLVFVGIGSTSSDRGTCLHGITHGDDFHVIETPVLFGIDVSEAFTEVVVVGYLLHLEGHVRIEGVVAVAGGQEACQADGSPCHEARCLVSKIHVTLVCLYIIYIIVCKGTISCT